MNRQLNVPAGLTALVFLAFATPGYAQDQPDKHHSHMQKMDMMHATDEEVASEYKSEASELRGKAESHRKASQMYRARGTGGKVNYANVARHCEKLAKFYEDAAREAEGVASELAK